MFKRICQKLSIFLGSLCVIAGVIAASMTVYAKTNFNIITSFYPIYIETLNVADGIPGVTVENLTGPLTGCLHDYQLTPDNLKKLEKAQIFVINGAGMEAFMDKIVKNLPKLKVADASKNIPLTKNSSDGEANPHLWVSISDAILQVRNIGDQLAKADPAHADQYKANASKYISKLQAQRTKMHQILDKVKQRDIVTFHEAFPYFAKEFNLRIVAVIEREPGEEPSAADLADTIDIVKKSRCKALFAEPQYPAKAAETIARETGAKVYTLDPAVTGPAKTSAYIDIMEENLKVLQKALK